MDYQVRGPKAILVFDPGLDFAVRRNIFFVISSIPYKSLWVQIRAETKQFPPDTVHISITVQYKELNEFKYKVGKVLSCTVLPSPISTCILFNIRAVTNDYFCSRLFLQSFNQRLFFPLVD